jgi:copper chaperone
MEAIKFKTNIQCSGCVEKVTPHLNKAIGRDNWQVDIVDPSKVLTVVGDTDEAKVKAALAKAGYKAEKV